MHCTLISDLYKSEPTTCGDLQRGEYSSMGQNTHCGTGSGLSTYSGHDPAQMTYHSPGLICSVGIIRAPVLRMLRGLKGVMSSPLGRLIVHQTLL